LEQGLSIRGHRTSLFLRHTDDKCRNRDANRRIYGQWRPLADPGQSEHEPTKPAEPVGSNHRPVHALRAGDETTANFGAGITLASPLTINSATSATAVLNIDPVATTGSRNVTLTTSTEVATLLNGFTVTASPPALLSVNPNTGQQGQVNLDVHI